jgi:hypothetical protein
MNNKTYAQGDINSQERGSGARDNGEKPHWGLLPLSQLVPLFHDCLLNEGPNPEDPITIEDCIYHIALFQRTGQGADDLLRHSLAYLMDQMNADLWNAFEEVIRVWEHGEKVYAPFNWMKGMSWNSVIACYMRHVKSIKQGVIIDQESGRLHAAHLVCNAMMLVHFASYYLAGNDLPVRWYQEEQYARSIQRRSE